MDKKYLFIYSFVIPFKEMNSNDIEGRNNNNNNDNNNADKTAEHVEYLKQMIDEARENNLLNIANLFADELAELHGRVEENKQ
jgi:hypothetical protein